ncbi:MULTISPECIES: c-type cytochrome biogenesis protein CcsB [unclassified Amycolatopsis]|uniref:c-type cytochrome biogenesis protein CcsB n=1 Tax=unclassified Amycolatopsis TaxID=2618356 RepID=UPI002E12FD29|nr:MULTISPECIES: c-type cytochrome biogenesis protein CcsB [unclassified Amycolatopsis]WSJ75800.1 c-type cytochrome biogenesis protein CcsB [Amycolatopsis sp. NBC_01307]WSK80601.1 c-type cytochrome biogenesis protein CcsB [Amycolatopsis sp. NBC_01286]
MPINETLSQYSDWLYTTAAAIYVVALMFTLIEQGFGAKGRLATERAKLRARELVGAGGPPIEQIQAEQRAVGRPERIGRMGAALLVLGALLQLSAIVLRGLAVHRAPWGNMYEYGMAVTFITVVTWLIVMWKFPVRHLTGFLLLPVVILMFINGTLLYTIAAPVQPALQSYWLAIHVSAAIIGSGVFLVPGVASVLFLFRAAYDKDNTKFARFASKLPAADVLDRIAYRTTIFAFPVFTFGVLCGAVWAESAWGRFWGWDPKETVAFIAWVVYAAYLHSRATAGWRGARAAAINIVGFAAIIFNLFFVNLVTAGLHSYAGVG